MRWCVVLMAALVVASGAGAQVNPLDPPGAGVGGLGAPLQPAGPRPGEAPAAGQLPAILKPGMRWYFHEGTSVVHNVPWHLVPQAAGQLRVQVNGNSGAVWYHAIDILKATPESVVANGRKYKIADIQRDVTTLGGAGAVVGNGTSLGQYWVHPGRLAAIAEGRQPGLTVNRVKYELAGRTYDGLSIVDQNERMYASQVYDLATGVLLSGSTADRNAPVTVPDGRGGVMPAPGAVQINHFRLVGMREMAVPWAKAAAPAWLAAGREMAYTGTYSAVGPTGAQTLGLTRSCRVAAADGGVAVVESVSRFDQGRGIWADSPDTQAFGVGQLMGMFVPVEGLRELRPNSVIDEDRVTHFRVTYAGVVNGLAVFVEQGPTDRNEVGYDVRSGVVAWVRTTTQIAPTVGNMVTEIRLTGQR